MSNKYRMLLFDVFNTLVLSDASRRPTMEVEGKSVVTTAHLLHEVLAPRHPGVEPMQIYRAMEAARLEAQAQWGSDFREPSALDKFRQISKILGVQEDGGDMPRKLLERHMEVVIGSFTFPTAHLDLLENLRKSYKLAIFSNFDHAPALIGLLRAKGIEDIFDPIVISERIGFRKPGRNAFRHALALAREQLRHILFIGDSLNEDVKGARAVNLDVAWVNPKGREAPAECSPTYELRNLLELEALLGTI